MLASVPMNIRIEPIPCLEDNYAYLISLGEDAWLVDPSEAGPPSKVLDDRALRLRGILLTHHHWDHVGGVPELLRGRRDASEIWVAAHQSDRGRIEHQTHFVEAPRGAFVETGLSIGTLPLRGMHIPGHTMGAIAWLLSDENQAHCFTGDTLFAAGCGRLFEGTPADMYESLSAICALPDETLLWFGHEYTAANLRFARFVEPTNDAIAQRAANLAEATTPTTVALEKATNPFVRAGSAAELGERRQAKDTFRG
jgi:hydroxyacylglutathione hydrolase